MFPPLSFDHASLVLPERLSFVLAGTNVHWEDDGYEKSIQVFSVQGNDSVKEQGRDWYFYVSGDFLEQDDTLDAPAAIRFEEIYETDSKFFINRRGAYTNISHHIENALEINSRTHDAIVQLSKYMLTLVEIDDHDLYALSPKAQGFAQGSGEFWTVNFDVGVIGDMRDDDMWEMSTSMHFEDEDLWLSGED